MNRKERRLMQKNLGLNKHYKKESKEQRFTKWRENQSQGKQMENEMKENVIRIQNMTAEEKMNVAVAEEAEKIARKKQIPIIDAMVEAQAKWEKNQKL